MTIVEDPIPEPGPREVRVKIIAARGYPDVLI
jgi:NADPH:quinone reductase-like Zn-dependent oxidoreductase